MSPDLEEKVGNLVLSALACDGSHHKQWYLVKIANLLNIDPEEIEEHLGSDDEGIPP